MRSRAAADEAVISPLTREPLQPHFFPNVALRQRIESHADDDLRVAEAAAAAARAEGEAAAAVAEATGRAVGRAEGRAEERKRQAEAASSAAAEAKPPKRARRR